MLDTLTHYFLTVTYIMLRLVTDQEATYILNSGLALMPVQHVRKQAWSPNQGLGQQDGQEAAGNAETVGFPDSVSLWCDLERVNRSTQPQDVIDYCEAWYQAVSVAGHIPGRYGGGGVLLARQRLYQPALQHLL